MTTSLIHQPPLMPDLIIEGLNRYDDIPCLVLGDQVHTYTDVREGTSQFAQALASKGLGKDSRIAVISGNRPEVLFNVAAMQISGCCGSALHPMGSLEDHAYILNDAKVEALIYDPTLYEQRAQDLAEKVPSLKHLLSFGETEVGEDYLELSKTFAPKPLVSEDISGDDICTIVYTGGTTGRPKGVMQTHRAFAYMTMIQAAEWQIPDTLRLLIATPLSHSAAAFFVPTLQRGGAMYVPQNFDPNSFFDMVEKYHITATMLVPVMIYYLLDAERSKTADMLSMETIFYGASPMSPARLQEGIERWGQIFYQYFGQSEAPMVLTNMRKEDHDLSKPERLASCGRPSPWMHLTLLDDKQQPVAKGEAGEICVRGPLVMQQYYNLPEQTAEAFEGGWLHTGDIGRLDDDGFLFIVDRKKDMIVTGGFNVFPKEVEDSISSNPAVAQVAVIGVPDDRWGEAVKAVIVLKDPAAASDALGGAIMQSVKEAKGSVQTPKYVDFVDSIPLTAIGKPDKKTLKAQYWQGQDRNV
ncbi:Long-chain-fatty-acid--CoA ligase [Sinobacterium norvegicum]|uniref:Long-chain-fatty-acid--CoA ligase n=1 Tax=Sinobacterium norvegicum TaxID=1641715 RepID=A0ABM9ADR1_9GAMM|nr:AMP-binding protein [Sinobacterium norvegicum]CAH0991174.1 Long-chain-fatty-acid--CoA ligase [Sinobacterium norvegicum]